MHPILFTMPDFIPVLGGRQVYSYGFLLGLSWLLGWMLFSYWVRKDKIPDKVVTWIVMTTLVGGVLGARILHLLSHPSSWTGPASIFDFSNGGLVAYGGMIGASVFAGLYVVYVAKAPFWKLADHAAPTVALGLGATRVGCHMFGCDFGRETSAGLSIRFPMWDVQTALDMGSHGPAAFTHHLSEYAGGIFDHVRFQVVQVLAAMSDAHGQTAVALRDTYFAFEAKYHTLAIMATGGASQAVWPTQIMSSANGFLACGVMIFLHSKRRFDGMVFLAFIAYYAVTRFVIESLRADPQRGTALGLSTSQLISIFMLGGALYWFRRRWKSAAKSPAGK